MNSNRFHSNYSSPFPCCSAADTARHARTPSKITTPGGVPAIHLGMLPKDSPLYNSAKRSRGRTQLHPCSNSNAAEDCGPLHLSTTLLACVSQASSAAAALHARPAMALDAPVAAAAPSAGCNDATRFRSGSCTAREISPERACYAVEHSVDSALPVISWETVGRKQSASLGREAAPATPSTNAPVEEADVSAAASALSFCPQRTQASPCQSFVAQLLTAEGCSLGSSASAGECSALCPAAPCAEPSRASEPAADPSDDADCCNLPAAVAAQKACVATALPQPSDLAAEAPTAPCAGSAQVDCAITVSAVSNRAVSNTAVSNPAVSECDVSECAVLDSDDSAAGERGTSQLHAALERQHVLQTALTAAEKRAALLQQQKRRLLEQVSRLQQQAAAAAPASGGTSTSAGTFASANGDTRAAAHVAVQTDAPSILEPLLADLESFARQARARLLSAELGARSEEHETLSQRCTLAEATAREAVALCEAVIRSASRFVDGTPQQQSPRPPSSANGAQGTPADTACADALYVEAATPRRPRTLLVTPGAGRSLTGSCSSLEGASRDELVAYGRARFRQLREMRSAALTSPACSSATRTADVLGAS